MPDRLAPTDDERGALVGRVAVIDTWLRRARPDAIVRSVGMVRGLMASSASADVKTIMDGYVLVLGEYPEAVIERACQRFLKGHIGNRVYAPTPAEIAYECREAVAPALAERSRIAAILDAEVYDTPSPADQEKIQARYRQYVADTEKRAAMPKGKAPEPLAPTRDPNLTADLESRRVRRETREATEAEADPSVPHPSHEETESAS